MRIKNLMENRQLKRIDRKPCANCGAGKEWPLRARAKEWKGSRDSNREDGRKETPTSVGED